MRSHIFSRISNTHTSCCLHGSLCPTVGRPPPSCWSHGTLLHGFDRPGTPALRGPVAAGGEGVRVLSSPALCEHLLLSLSFSLHHSPFLLFLLVSSPLLGGAGKVVAALYPEAPHPGWLGLNPRALASGRVKHPTMMRPRGQTHDSQTGQLAEGGGGKGSEKPCLTGRLPRPRPSTAQGPGRRAEPKGEDTAGLLWRRGLGTGRPGPGRACAARGAWARQEAQRPEWQHEMQEHLPRASGRFGNNMS